MCVQIGRQRKEILQLSRAGITVRDYGDSAIGQP